MLGSRDYRFLYKYWFYTGDWITSAFVNLTRNIRVTIHGDDITSLGTEENLLWLKQQLETRYELKFGGLLGPDRGDVKDAMILNRLVHFDVDETTYESDPRHVQILLSELNLKDAKSVVSPGVSRKDEETELLDAATISRFRSLVMRANYLALDRPDIAYAAKELARRMSAPTVDDWAGLKRLVRYLKGRPRLVWFYKQQEDPGEFCMFSDSDDGGCSKTRKSTSSGVLMHGAHLIKAYSSTQHIIAMSSGESEFYAGVCAGASLIGARSMAEDLGCTRSGILLLDANAAKSMLTRRGFGRAKHIHRSYLWLQQRINEKDIRLQKVGTKVNPSDLGTKFLEGVRIQELLQIMSLRYEDVEHRMTLHV